MAISPPSDIVLDVARAAEPTTLEAARARLASRTAAAGGRPRRGVLAGRSEEFAARRGARRADGKARPKPYVDFEAMVLQTFVQSMMPKRRGRRLRRGHGGDMWKSMMSQQLGTVMADRGGIGIADSLLKGHYSKATRRSP